METTNKNADREPRSKNWVLTIGTIKGNRLPQVGELVPFLEETAELFAFQEEEGEEGSRHYQCCLKTKWSTRKSTLLRKTEKHFGPDMLPCFRYDYMRGTWEEGVKYTTKEETRVGVPVSNLPLYEGCDVQFLKETTRRRLWQTQLLDELCLPNGLHYKTPNDRKIYWISDNKGNSGKSKFTKFMYLFARNTVKIPFGTATQMRSSIIAMGPQKCYFVDIPRTLGRDDDINSVITLLEDLKNGFVVSSMYGKNQQLVMHPPHVVVFINIPCPIEKMSGDRWIRYYLVNQRLMEINEYNGSLSTANSKSGEITS